jgi:hypothetical protein
MQLSGHRLQFGVLICWATQKREFWGMPLEEDPAVSILAVSKIAAALAELAKKWAVPEKMVMDMKTS